MYLNAMLNYEKVIFIYHDKPWTTISQLATDETLFEL